MRERRADNAAERKRYTRGDLSNLIFWSFFASQGDKPLNASLFVNAFVQNPELQTAAARYRDALGSDESAWLKRPSVRKLIERVHRYRNSRMHGSSEEGVPLETAVRESFENLKSFLRAVDDAPRYANNPAANPLHAFVAKTAERETAFLEKKGARAGLDASRKKIGWSMLYRFGLSPEREQHLREGPVLPAEFQDVWRAAGDYARAQADALGPTTVERLKKLGAAYKAETGEAVPFVQ